MLKNRHTVAAVVGSTVSPFELSVACEVFGIERPEIMSPWYGFFVACSEGSRAFTGMGFYIETEYGLADLERADTIVVPAGWAGEETPSENLLDALRRAHDRGARLMSVCTGAFVLAEAGLLDGRRATTHWMHAERLARSYPRVRVDPKVLYVDEGDILTSAGTAAGLDMCLHVVRRDHGAEVANALARRIVVPPHRDGGQAQFIDAPIAPAGNDDPVVALLPWIQAHLGAQLRVDDLARRANLSPRQFARRFKAATGATPLQWLLGQRILLAQRMLETTDNSVDAIAAACGFGSAAVFRIHFQRAMATSPNAYRRTFHSGDALTA